MRLAATATVRPRRSPLAAEKRAVGGEDGETLVPENRRCCRGLTKMAAAAAAASASSAATTSTSSTTAR